MGRVSRCPLSSFSCLPVLEASTADVLRSFHGSRCSPLPSSSSFHKNLQDHLGVKLRICTASWTWLNILGALNERQHTSVDERQNASTNGCSASPYRPLPLSLYTAPPADGPAHVRDQRGWLPRNGSSGSQALARPWVPPGNPTRLIGRSTLSRVDHFGAWGASFGVAGSDGQGQGGAEARRSHGHQAAAHQQAISRRCALGFKERGTRLQPRACWDAEDVGRTPAPSCLLGFAAASHHSGTHCTAGRSVPAFPSGWTAECDMQSAPLFAYPLLGRNPRLQRRHNGQQCLGCAFSTSAACWGSSPPSRGDTAAMESAKIQKEMRGGAGSNPRPVHPVYNLANAISGARLVSGPFVAGLIIQQQWAPALALLVAGGVSDWLDGFVAKQYGQPSVLGSYLDPLADKVLICCTVGALGYEGSLPGFLVAIIIGRDVILVTGAVAERFRSIGWRWPGISEFLRVFPAEILNTPGSPPLAPHPDTERPQSQEGGKGLGHGEEEEEARLPVQAVPPAQLVQPSMISKLNTVLQFGLVGGCLTHSWYLWPEEAVLWGLGSATAVTTVVSGALYLRDYAKARK